MARNGGRLLVESLIALGARKCFGVPSESYLSVLDALHDTVGALDYVACRSESGAGIMASAYGKLTGIPGLCFVSQGSGVANAAAGIKDAAPVIVFGGQVRTGAKGREAFRGIDYRAVFGTIAKWVVEIDEVSRLPELLARAWTTSLAGRPGPVVIALPEDVLADKTDTPPLSGAGRIFEAAPDPKALQELRAVLGQSHKPVILLGGGNWSDDGRVALKAFAEASDIPVVAAFRFQDQFDNHSPVFVGEAGIEMSAHVRSLLCEADTVVAINVRFDETTTDLYSIFEVPRPKQSLIHIHASDSEIGEVYTPAFGIHAGANAFAQALAPVGGHWARWRAEARAAYERTFETRVQPGPVDMAAVTKWLVERLPADVIITSGTGNFTAWPETFVKYGARARLLASQSGGTGYGLPAAIAAKVAFPSRTVVCFAGDGDFQATCQELGTAMQADAQPIVLILNNGIYGAVRARQERLFPVRVFGTTLRNPDFVDLANAYGFHAERVADTADFPAAFERALASSTGAVLDLAISPEALTARKTLRQIRNEGLDALGVHV